MSITQPVCMCVFVALGIQHATRMRNSHKRYDFRKKKKVIEHKMCVSISSAIFFHERFLILRRTERGIIKNVQWSLCKVPVITVRF